MKKKDFLETLKIFMEDYKGFDWRNGTVVLINEKVPYICEGCWKIMIEQFKNREIARWTHSENIMVITLR